MTDQLSRPQGTASPALLPSLLRAMRPKQWAKNVLVFVAPGAAGVLTQGWFDHPTYLLRTLGAFIVFCAASAGTYLLNDVVDRDADRRHPTKRNRPIASGAVPVPVALGASFVLIAGSVIAAAVRTPDFALVVGLYVVLTSAYSMWLKQQPVLDLIGLSSGFILRLLGGAYAAEVEVTYWFLLIACFGALFIATCKRSAEKSELGADGASIRPTLGVYTDSYLNFLKAVSAGMVLMSYALFAVERAREHRPSSVWILTSIVPFAVAFLRYALLVEQGKGSAPEEVILGDRQLAVIGVIWAVLVGVSVYVR